MEAQDGNLGKADFPRVAVQAGLALIQQGEGDLNSNCAPRNRIRASAQEKAYPAFLANPDPKGGIRVM